MTNVALAGLSVGTGIMAARLLGPDGRGELLAIQTIPTLLAGVSTLGLPAALIYHIAQSPEESRGQLLTASVLAVLTSLIFMALGWVILPIALEAQSWDTIGTARTYLLTIPIAATGGLASNALRGIGAFGVWNGLRFLLPGVWAAILLSALGFVPDTSAYSIAIAFLIARAAASSPAIFAAIRLLRGSLKIQWFRLRSLLRFGLPSVGAEMPKALNLRLDQALMGAFLASDQLGYYAVAVTWSFASAPALQAVGYVAFPRLAGLEDEGERRALAGKITRLSLLASAAAMLVLLPITPFAIPVVFGADFGPAIPVASLLVVAGAIANSNSIFEQLLRGLGRPSAALRAEVWGLSATALGLAGLLPSFGLIGAGLASLLGYSTAFLVYVRRLTLQTGLSHQGILIPRSQDMAWGLRLFRDHASQINIRERGSSRSDKD